MLERHRGGILNVASIAGYLPDHWARDSVSEPLTWPRNSPTAASASTATTTGEATAAEGATTAEPSTARTR
jgi:hypothetical protein